MQGDSYAQQVLHPSNQSNTATAYSASSQGPDYLRALVEDQKAQPLCGNREGWGPLSPDRYDFTPCFLDVWIASVAVLFGLVMGSGAIWFLLRKKSPQDIKKDWHFYAKLSIIGALVTSTALQASLQIEALPGIWYGDFRFWTSVITVVSLGVIGTVQYLEHWRSRQPNGVVLFYWLLLLIAHGVKLRSLVSQEAFKNRLPYFITFTVSTGLVLLEFVLEYLVPKRQSAYDALGDEDECPAEYADVFSILTFSWMTPMMKYGYRNFLGQDDLWNLRKRDTTATTGRALQEAWESQSNKRRPSLWIAMFSAFGGPYLRGAIIKSGSDVLAFIQPQLLRLLISWVDSHRTENPQPIVRGVAIALCMFVVSVSQTAFLHQYFQRAFETGMRIRASLIAMIYSKSQRLSNEGRASKSTGDIVNYMAVDTQRLQDLTQYGQQLWSAPFQITLCMLSLYQLVGYSMFAGVGIMVLSIPLNGVIARYQRNLQKRQMKNKDARTRLMTEILNNMKSIKLYAWGQAFMKKLTHIRNDLELNTLRKIGAVSAVQNFTWSSTPVFVSTATFAVFVLVNDRPLSTELVFPALTLFNMLSFPLMVLPMVITAIIEATVAVGRLTDFFNAEELQPDAVERRDAAKNPGDEAVRVRDASFTWDRNGGKECLKNINFTARKGELSCIVGRVGMGKTSTLESILGNVWKTEGDVTVYGSVAYVAQQPWVMNASVKENVIFGHRWDPHFYEKTIKACALVDDFKSLPDGDKTEVGERGISLSGGQKARLTLARAVYARADVYLLDDVLSAVDQHVGRHIIDNVLGPNGLLASKTRVLATNAIVVLDTADYITMLRDGRVLEKGTREQLVAMRGEVASLIKTAANDTSSEPSTPSQEPTSPSSDDSKTVYGTRQASEDDEAAEAREGVASLAPIRPGGSSTARKASMSTLRRASTVTFKGPQGRITDDETGDVKTKQSKEFSEQGKVKWDVYKEYAKANNTAAVIIYLLALVAAQSLVVGSNLWLKHWSELNQRYGGNPDIGKNIGIYFAFGIGGSVFMVLQTLLLWIFCSIEVRIHLHAWSSSRVQPL
jgi:ATP-binding cassette subfamily C (CFTR/MRP) protein 1